jgi:signal transduction histidine kinase
MNDPVVQRPLDRADALGDFVSLLQGGDGDVRAALAAVLGRPDLRIAYWLPDAERWVDREGERQVIDVSQPAVRVISHHGQRVAALSFDRPLPERTELEGRLAAAAGLAFENERLQLALNARLEEQQALRRVATVVARQHSPEEVLALVTSEIAHHLAADAAMTARFDGPGMATVLADWGAPGVATFPTGKQIVIGGPTAFAQVQKTWAPARVDSYEGMPGEYPAELRQLGMRAAVAAPILVDGRLWGAVAAASVEAPFARGAEARLGAFAELVAQAIANVDARIKLDESRARIVQAADDARRKIERDLHDGAQQRLVALALSLGVVANNAEPAAAAEVKACARELRTALAELRKLARGIHPVVLTERGLEAALHELAARCPVPVVVDAELDGRLPPAHEAALYFVAAEALTNVAKYARAGATRVTVHCHDGWAHIAITDDGVGGAAERAGSGLRGLADRVEALGGRLAIESSPGEGTTVRAGVPVAAR